MSAGVRPIDGDVHVARLGIQCAVFAHRMVGIGHPGEPGRWPCERPLSILRRYQQSQGIDHCFPGFGPADAVHGQVLIALKFFNGTEKAVTALTVNGTRIFIPNTAFLARFYSTALVLSPAGLITMDNLRRSSMENSNQHIGFFKWVSSGFVAGFLATLTFHQVFIWLLHQAGIAPFSPYNMAAVPPWGIPAVISLALWGGVWGIVFAGISKGFRHHKGFWVSAFLFGAIFPSLVALLVVAPLKGLPLGGGWHWPLLVTAFLANGAWGFGTGAFIDLFYKWNRSHELLRPKCGPGMLCKE